jgi:hypothetical protein
MKGAEDSRLPDGISRSRSIDLEGRARHPVVRGVLLSCIAALPALALLGFFGQQPSTTTASAPAATLSLSAPDALRGGLIYQVTITVTARGRLDDPRLVLSSGWFDGTTMNTVTPDPVSEAQREGGVALAYGSLLARQKLQVRMQFQVNPTDVAHRNLRVALFDGTRPVTTIRHTMRIWP